MEFITEVFHNDKIFRIGDKIKHIVSDDGEIVSVGEKLSIIILKFMMIHETGEIDAVIGWWHHPKFKECRNIPLKNIDIYISNDHFQKVIINAYKKFINVDATSLNAYKKFIGEDI